MYGNRAFEKRGEFSNKETATAKMWRKDSMFSMKSHHSSMLTSQSPELLGLNFLSDSSSDGSGGGGDGGGGGDSSREKLQKREESWSGIYTTTDEYVDESTKAFQPRKARDAQYSIREEAPVAPQDPLVVVKTFMDSVISVSHRKHEQKLDQVRE
jgi:hypothetical protein